MKKTQVLAYLILALILLSQTIQCSNTIRLDGHITLQKIRKDPIIEITITEPLQFNTQDNSEIQNFQFFVLKTVSRNKSKAYLKLLKNYQKLVNTLVQKLIIGDQRLLIKSKIKQKYLKKKRLWQFGIMFMMQGQAAQLSQCYHDIAKFGVTRINSKPKTKAINQRIIASNAFYKLKEKIWNQLSRMPGMGIQKVLKVDLIGFSIPNSISLDKKQIQQNLKELKQEKHEDMSYLQDYFFLKAQVPRYSKSLTLRATFQVGEDIDLDLIPIDSQYSQDSQFQSSDDSSDSRRSNDDNTEM